MTSNFDQVCIIHVSVWQKSYIATSPLVSAIRIFSIASKNALLHNIKSFNVISLQLKQAKLQIYHISSFILRLHMRKILCKSAIPLILFYHEIEEQKIQKYHKVFQPQLF